MKFEIYCDESRPDLLCSQKPTAKYMAIGGLWLPAEDRVQFRKNIHALRDKKAEFVAAYVAGQRTIKQIRTNPLWV